MRRAYLDTPEGQLHYAIEGEGRPLLLLHHTPRSLEFYRPIIPRLSGHRRVIAVDTPGFGNSDPPRATPTIEYYAGRLVDFADRLDLTEFDLFGSNTGAGIAIEIAVTRPERVRRMGLMAVPYFPSPEARRQALEGIEGHHRMEPDGSNLMGQWQVLMDWWRWEAARRDGIPGEAAAAALAAAYISDIVRAGENWDTGAAAAFRYDPSGKLDAIRAPTLVIGLEGERDPALHYRDFLRQSELVASLIPGSEFVRLPGSQSVLTMLTCLDQLAAALDAFF